jgi:hypothetical protein
VGEKFIRETAARYGIKADGALPAAPDISKVEELAIEPVVHDPDLPKAVIVDIDGTVARHVGIRDHHDYDRVNEDVPVWPIIGMVRLLGFSAGYEVIFVSGRPDSCRQATLDWIREFVHMNAIGTRGSTLLMRQIGDKRGDDVVKLELFNKFIRGKYHVRWVLDDRDRVVAMWRRLGLTCLQVAPGDF